MRLRKKIPPPNQKVLWYPLIFTLFIGFVFLDPLQRHASRLEWELTIFAVAVFFALYIILLAHLFKRRAALWAIAGISLLGFIFAPFNAGAAVFIIYSTSFVPFAVGGEIGLTAGVIGLILAVVAAESWVLHLSWVFLAYSAGYAVILGGGNTYAARQAFSAERLAKIAERERIARDLHDVLGHTLSVIILKSELAGKLLDRDLERAKAEIGDVERISREALAEVRHTISGYRAKGLQAEFERAKSTLETAGVTVECHVTNVGVTPAQEGVLAMALREAITNVVRHAGAKTCRLQLQEANGVCRLEIQDDGRGGLHTEGHGLCGMRERIEALGGTLLQDAHDGTKLTITIPLPANQGIRNS
jgi:two-component system, NarL family, sensor histidine kinase DesK